MILFHRRSNAEPAALCCYLGRFIKSGRFMRSNLFSAANFLFVLTLPLALLPFLAFGTLGVDSILLGLGLDHRPDRLTSRECDLHAALHLCRAFSVAGGNLLIQLAQQKLQRANVGVSASLAAAVVASAITFSTEGENHHSLAPWHARPPPAAMALGRWPMSDKKKR